MSIDLDLRSNLESRALKNDFFSYFFCDIKGLDLAAKPSSKVGLSSNQARKRLSRKSPGPELRKTLRSIPPPTNVTGPETVGFFI